MQEKFGKLTADQLRQLIGFLPVLANLRAEFEADLAQHPEKLAKLAPDKLNWASAYELPFIEHLSQLIVIMGKGDATLKGRGKGSRGKRGVNAG